MASSILLNIADSDSSEEDEELPENNKVVAELKAAETLQDSLKAFENSFLGRFGAASVEFQEASQAILEDCWNVSAWLTMLEEVERGRGGSTSVAEIYSQFLDQFPRASKIWKALTDYHLQRDDADAAGEAFRSCLPKCRNVDLWSSYLDMTKRRTVDKISKYSEQYASAKKTLEAAFERAIDNVGLSMEASGIWRRYVDFVKEWPDASPMDAGIKMRMLRGVYQRVISVPLDDIDNFWREYEALENSAGEHLAAQLLPEHRAKYMHAKVVLRDRKRLTAKIVFDRIATPPTNYLTELQQLDLWNKWISFELSNPCNLSPDLQRNSMRCLFERALCCHRHHPEVWLTFSRFELNQTYESDSSNNLVQVASFDGDAKKMCKSILMEGVECNTGVAILRIALAELEESSGNAGGAREILRQLFADAPSAFTFSVLQRHIRRLDGRTAARRLFSDTMSARLDGTLNYEVYVSHAMVEMDINGDQSAAVKSMELAKAVSPTLSYNLGFIMVYASILTRCADLDRIRWIFHSALGDEVMLSVKGNKFEPFRGKVVSNLSSRAKLWEELLRIELALGLSDIARINDLRSKVKHSRSRLPPSALLTSAPPNLIYAADDVVFHDYAIELFEKYSVNGISLPPLDASLKDRCRGSSLIEELVRNAEHEINSMEAGKKNRGRMAPVVTSALDADSSILAGLPAIFKELLSKLPPPSDAEHDVDAFVDALRRTVLPPRPSDEPLGGGRIVSQADENGSNSRTLLGKRKILKMHDESSYSVNSMDVIEDAEVGVLGVGDTDVGYQAEELLENREDVFKKRHRAKMYLE